MKKKEKEILLISHNFWPENFPINSFVKLISKKYKITILTNQPNYPLGKIFKGYSGIKFTSQKFINNSEILRVPTFPRGNGSICFKILNYLFFPFFSIFFFPKILKKKYSFIFVYAPSPVIHALVGVILKKILRIKLYIWLQDFLLTSIKLNVKFFFFNNIVKKILNYIYFNSDIIFTQSKKYKNYFNKNLRKKIVYLPNSTNYEFKKNLSIFKKLKNFNKNHFNICYFGNLGSVQEFQTIIDSAEKIKNKKINFHFFGEGVLKNKLKETIKAKKISNFFIYNYVNFNDLKTISRYVSVFFLSLKKNKLLNITVPSKLQFYMSCGKPIIGEISGEAKRIINEAKCGFVINHKNEKKMIKIINELYKIRNQNKFKNYGINAKKYFNNFFSNKIIRKTFLVNAEQ